MEYDFGIDNVTVIFNLLLNESLNREYDSIPLKFVSYNVTSSSQVQILSLARTRFQLVFPYNTYFNVSIVTGLCRQYYDLSVATVVPLSYGK